MCFEAPYIFDSLCHWILLVLMVFGGVEEDIGYFLLGDLTRELLLRIKKGAGESIGLIGWRMSGCSVSL